MNAHNISALVHGRVRIWPALQHYERVHLVEVPASGEVVAVAIVAEQTSAPPITARVPYDPEDYRMSVPAALRALEALEAAARAAKKGNA